MIIANESLAAFKAVFDNATNDKRFKRRTFKTIKRNNICTTYNLLTNEYEYLSNDIYNTNHSQDKKDNEKIITYLVEGAVVKDDISVKEFPNLISPGNMDKEILRSTFSILGLFLTSNQLITVHTKKDNKV
jgi:hypothetical protein